MTDPTSEPFFCPQCGVHRTRSATGPYPPCDDKAKHPERAK